MKQVPPGERRVHKYYLGVWLEIYKKGKVDFRKRRIIYKLAIDENFKFFLKFNKINQGA